MADLSRTAEARSIVKQVPLCQASAMEQRSSLYQALDALLGDETLADFIGVRRGYGASWRRIARDLTDKTGVEIKHETVRGWVERAESGSAA